MLTLAPAAAQAQALEAWVQRFSGPGNGDDPAKALAVDTNGNVYVVGVVAMTGLNDLFWDNYLTIKYSSAGVPLWTNVYDGPVNHSDTATAMAVDPSGNVYAAGRSRSSMTGDDLLVVKYVIPPIITSQPLSRTNAVGSIATFTVETTGSAPLTYQWRRQGTDLVNGPGLSGVTTANLQIMNVQLADAAGYSVVVTNAHGSVTSSVAQLTVYIAANPGRFTDLAYSPATGFSFVFREGALGRTYRIQTSLSPAEGSWVDWVSFNYTGPIGIMDLGAVATPNKFYRAVSP